MLNWVITTVEKNIKTMSNGALSKQKGWIWVPSMQI